MPEAVAVASTQSVVSMLLAEWGKSPDDPRMAVDSRDEMLAFLRSLHDGDPERGLCAYYLSGHDIASLLLQVLRWRFGEARATRSLLDFASGYGRVTRFLLDEVPPEALTVAEVLPGALAFQRQTFGVGAVASTARVSDLVVPGPFAAIFVTSLFTHLPERAFGEWLGTLLGNLEPGGVLAFSTHDLGLLPPEHRPAGGICFQPWSENRELATTDYGSIWVDEPFVRAALAATRLPHAAMRFERAVCHFQDLWVVVPEAEGAFEGLAFRTAPELFVEACEVVDGELVMSGWAHTRYGRVARLEMVLDDVPLGSAEVTLPRPDVAVVHGPDALASGWQLRVALPPGVRPAESVLLVRALDDRGKRQPVRVGRLMAVMLTTAQGRVRQLLGEVYHRDCQLAAQRAWAEREIDLLQSRVAAMEASRFWKMRNAWFAVKRALRLTDEA